MKKENEACIEEFVPLNSQNVEDVRKCRKTNATPSLLKYILPGAFIGLFGIVTCLAFYYGTFTHKNLSSRRGTAEATSPYYGVYANAAVASDAAICSSMGKKILKNGGNAVDAAITTTLCVGVVNSHSAGIGGGHFSVIFNATTQQSVFIDGREVAPLASHPHLFVNNKDLKYKGGYAVGVPGEIAGLWKSHQLYGNLPWKDLLQPVIDICQDGYQVTKANARAIKCMQKYIRNESYHLGEIFLNDDQSLKLEGQVVQRPKLAKTLQKIAVEGADAFYRGSLANDIILDLQEAVYGTIITKKDLNTYQANVEHTSTASLGDYTLFSSGLPGSGPVIALILNVLEGYHLTEADLNEENIALTYHRICEAFRFGYAKRAALGDDVYNLTMTELAANLTTNWFADDIRARISDTTTHPVAYYDPPFDVPEDHGTAHLSVVDAEGNAVSTTTTVNTYFGSKVRGSRTGIIFNNEMADFSTPGKSSYYGIPPSPSNFILPGKRPLSSMTPTIIVKNVNGSQKVHIVSGAAGGKKIISGTAMSIINMLWLGKTAEESLEMKRIHDQLIPDRIDYEDGFDESVIASLQALGHKVRKRTNSYYNVQAIKVNEDDNTLQAACDSRKGGSPDGY